MIRCDPKDPDIEFITTYYGITDEFPLDQIFSYSETMNKLFIVNKGLSDLLYADQNKQLNLIAGGAETFIRNTSKMYSGTECIFRISQNGVHHIYPFMTKRIYTISLELFKVFLTNKKMKLEDIPDADFKEKMNNLSCGCFVCLTEVKDGYKEALVMHRHFTHVNTMVSDLNLHKIKTCLIKEI